MEEIKLSSSSKEAFLEKLEQESKKDYTGKTLAIVIDGSTLVYALSEEDGVA